MQFPPSASYDPSREAVYGYYTIFHKKRIVNGWSGIVSPVYWELLKNLREFPSKYAVDYLRAMDVNYIIVHGSGNTDNWKSFSNRLSAIDGVRYYNRYGEDFVYKLKPAAEAREKMEFELLVPAVFNVRAAKKINAGILLKNEGTAGIFFPPAGRLNVKCDWYNDGKKIKSSKLDLQAPVFVAAGEEKTLCIKLKLPSFRGGSYCLKLHVKSEFLNKEVIFEKEIEVKEIALPTSISPGILKAGIINLAVPAKVREGSVFTVEGEAVNNGDTLWLADVPGRGNKGKVSLGCLWYDAGGKEVIFDGINQYQPRCRLSSDVSPGQRIKLKAQFPAGVKPGLYKVKIGFVAEQVSWFPEIKALKSRYVYVLGASQR